MKRLRLGYGLLIAMLPIAAQTRYVVTDLGSLGGVSPYGGAPASAHGINNAGQVAGNSYLPTGESRGFRTAPNSVINATTDAISTLGGSSSAVGGINNSGQVAGWSTLSNGHTHAMRVDADGSVHDLGTIGGTVDFSLANAINDLGQLTGASWRPTPVGAPCFGIGGSDAFLTVANSAITPSSDLGTLLSHCRGSDGYSVDASGRVVGYSAFGNLFNPVQHAMLYVPGSGLTDLGVLGGNPSSSASQGTAAVAYGINAAGQIIGSSTYSGSPFLGETHAFLTSASGPMSDLGTLGGTFSSASSINAVGQIVGYSGTAGDSAIHAFLYSNGNMSDINGMLGASPAWEIQNATAINDSGQMTAQGKLSDGSQHAVRLDPADVSVTVLSNLLSSPGLGLTAGQVSSLTDKLNNAIASIQAGLYKQATNQLNAFVSAVQTQVKVGKMSPVSASQLIAAANAIIAAIS